MPNEENVLNETVEMPDVTEDAFLSGLLDDEDAYPDDTEAADTSTGDDAETDTDPLDGADPEPEPASEDEDVAADEAEAGDTNQPDAEELMDLVHLGQTTSLPRSEVIKLAQKGMDYDHVKSQLDGLRNSDTQRMLAQLAADAGMTPDKYLQHIVGNVDERRAQEMAAAEGITPELAQRLITAEDAVKRYESQESARSERERKNRMLQEFIYAYPDIKAEDIPPEVWNEAHKGGNLKGAYAAYENKLLKERLEQANAEIEQIKQNESNKQKAVGSVRGSKTAATEDAFLSGLLGN